MGQSDQALYDFQIQVDAFRSGEWVKERPKLPGVYLVRAVGAEAGVQGHNQIVIYKDVHGNTFATQSWGGWWWSAPLPNLPPTPDVPGGA